MSAEVVQSSLVLRGGQLLRLQPCKLLLNIACQLLEEAIEDVHRDVPALRFLFIKPILVEEEMAVDELLRCPGHRDQRKKERSVHGNVLQLCLNSP